MKITTDIQRTDGTLRIDMSTALVPNVVLRVKLVIRLTVVCEPTTLTEYLEVEETGFWPGTSVNDVSVPAWTAAMRSRVRLV